ncbi:hypothetical protein [Streptomyces sp. NPDC047097]|uniref:hypothetical protein n=1 Tax=Streptomyces sp. NPDC047097 TaxID=3155260 RepID=UPI0033FC9AFE
MSGSTAELWTVNQVAEHLGVKPPSARGWLSRRGIAPTEYRPHPTSRRPQALYPVADIRAAHAAMPGQGARTDLADQNGTTP